MMQSSIEVFLTAVAEEVNCAKILASLGFVVLNHESE